MARATSIVEATPRSPTPPRSFPAIAFPAAVHCTACFLRGEQCVASSSSTGDPLDPAVFRLVPSTVRAQITALSPTCTPTTSRATTTLRTSSVHTLSSGVPTLLSPGVNHMQRAPITLRAPAARSRSLSEPDIVRIDWRKRRAQDVLGLQWLGKALQEIIERIWASPGIGAKAEYYAGVTATAPVMFSIPDGPPRFYIEDDMVRIDNGMRRAKGKGKGRESKYVEVEPADSTKQNESEGVFHGISEKISARSGVGRRVVESSRRALGSTRERREDRKELMTKMYAGVDYAL